MYRHENDYIPNAVMEYTLDGNTWQEFEVQPEENTTTEISLSFEEMEIQGFRWRGTGVDRNRWLLFVKLVITLQAGKKTMMMMENILSQRLPYFCVGSGAGNFRVQSDRWR